MKTSKSWPFIIYQFYFVYPLKTAGIFSLVKATFKFRTCSKTFTRAVNQIIFDGHHSEFIDLWTLHYTAMADGLANYFKMGRTNLWRSILILMHLCFYERFFFFMNVSWKKKSQNKNYLSKINPPHSICLIHIHAAKINYSHEPVHNNLPIAIHQLRQI